MRVLEFTKLLSNEFFVSEITVDSSIKNELYSEGKANKNILVYTPNPNPNENSSLLYVPIGANIYLPSLVNFTENKKKNKGVRKLPYPLYCTIISFKIRDKNFEEVALSGGIRFFEGDTINKLEGAIKTLSAYYSSIQKISTKLNNMFSEILISVCQSVKGEKNSPLHNSVIFPALQYIESNDIYKISIPQLASICNLSPATFRVRFSEIVGVSPIEYMSMIRLNKARELLTEGEMTVKEVAEALGYDSVSYFIRFYKKRTGRTPSEDMARRVK